MPVLRGIPPWIVASGTPASSSCALVMWWRTEENARFSTSTCATASAAVTTPLEINTTRADGVNRNH